MPADCRAVSTRRDAVLLARIRPAVNPNHPSCGEEPQTVEHLAAAVSKPCSIETATLRPTSPTALGFYRQPGQRASACWENPSLKGLGAISQQQKPPQHVPCQGVNQ